MTARPFDGGPLIAGHVIGLRRFSTHCLDWDQLRQMPEDQLDEPWLFPVSNSGFVWKPGVNMATCWHEGDDDYPEDLRHRVGGANCSCGFYAYWSREEANNVYGGSNLISGMIKAWGTITAGRHGFRAQKAEIICFFKEKHKFFDPAEFAEFYDVPLLSPRRAKWRFKPTKFSDLPKGEVNESVPPQEQDLPF